MPKASKVSGDWQWDRARHDSPEEGLDRLAAGTWPDGRAPSLRWILVHLIEEYARHNGHPDLLCEVVDGATGE